MRALVFGHGLPFGDRKEGNVIRVVKPAPGVIVLFIISKPRAKADGSGPRYREEPQSYGEDESQIAVR